MRKRFTSSYLSVLGDADLFHLAGDDEDDPLADVGDPVGAALQVMRHPDQAGGPGDGLGVFRHEGQQLAEDLVVEVVHLVVLGD